MALIVDGESTLFNVSTTFQEVDLPGAETHVVFQSRAAVRLVWGSVDASYYTYGIMTEPVILPANFRIRAETGTADVVLMSVSP